MNDKSFEEVVEKIKNIKFIEKFDIIVAIANGGIIPAALLNQQLGLPFYLLKLNLRDINQKQIYDVPQLLEEINFDYSDKIILLVEDRVKTGTTLEFAKNLLLKKAKQVRTFAVNGNADYSVYNESCFRFPWIL